MKHLDQRKDEILEDYSFEAPLTFLGRKYGCTRDTMRVYLIKWGVYREKKFGGTKK